MTTQINTKTKMTTEEKVLQILEKTGSILRGHFVYTSGMHGEFYVNKDAIYPHTTEIKKLCKLMAELSKDDLIDVVVGPEMGGIVLQTWTADYLTNFNNREVLGVYAEKTSDGSGNSGFCLKRNYDKLVKGKNVLIVDDIMTTGGSVTKVIEAVRSAGGNVIAIAVLCNRGNVSAKDIGVPILYTLCNINLKLHNEKDCPFCRKSVPINTNVGKGSEYLAKK